MHLLSVQLKNFKKFRNQTMDFAEPETGLAKPLVVLVGENGSGKSTILQAIAATLGTATRRIDNPALLDWPGFNLDLVGASWRMPSETIIEVGFSEDELNATLEYFEKVPSLSAEPNVVRPGSHRVARLTMKQRKIDAENAAQKFQFRGREYAKQVVKIVDVGQRVFERVGSVFWYTEHRTATSLTADVEPTGPLRFDENLLRRRLADIMQFHERVEKKEYELRPGQRDLFAEVEKNWAAVFPNRRFEGAVPRTDIDEVLSEPWFYLYDGHRQYELSELSGGERAIFPILFDFANWHINNSIILIDELELHLHPPLQQALIRALPRLGSNNQFIITTHSDWVAQLVPETAVYRVEASQ